jgi:hypothetical protein
MFICYYLNENLPINVILQYHQWLYTLDQQIQHSDQESLARLGYWLWRRNKHCRDKRLLAEEILHDCRQDDAVLRREWDAQVKHQTKPLPRVFVELSFLTSKIDLLVDRKIEKSREECC